MSFRARSERQSTSTSKKGSMQRRSKLHLASKRARIKLGTGANRKTGRRGLSSARNVQPPQHQLTPELTDVLGNDPSFMFTKEPRLFFESTLRGKRP